MTVNSTLNIYNICPSNFLMETRAKGRDENCWNGLGVSTPSSLKPRLWHRACLSLQKVVRVPAVKQKDQIWWLHWEGKKLQLNHFWIVMHLHTILVDGLRFAPHCKLQVWFSTVLCLVPSFTLCALGIKHHQIHFTRVFVMMLDAWQWRSWLKI